MNEITDDQAKRADEVLRMLLWIGLVLVIIGSVIIVATWPDADELLARGETYNPGTGGAGLVIGLAFHGFGGIMLLTGLIGYGVKTGIRAARAAD